MIVIVDEMKIKRFAIREQRNETRYYYTCTEYHELLLVCQGESFEELQGKKAVALFNLDEVDSVIVCDTFPSAPQEWCGQKIIQCTLAVKPNMQGNAEYFSKVLAETLGERKQ